MSDLSQLEEGIFAQFKPGEEKAPWALHKVPGFTPLEAWDAIDRLVAQGRLKRNHYGVGMTYYVVPVGAPAKEQ